MIKSKVCMIQKDDDNGMNSQKNISFTLLR